MESILKAALIPPTPSLKRFGHAQFHLLLSHLLDDDKYKSHYIGQRLQGAYLVLDNSAHEFNAGESAEKLLTQAVEIDAQEIVVPDTLEDYPQTVEGTLAAWETWGDSDAFRTHNPALMYVPQGKDLLDWWSCLEEQTRIHRYVTRRRHLRRDFVIGISKDYERWDGGIMHLISEYIYPLIASHTEMGIKVHVHLLGWGRDLWALSEISLKYPWIRSTDSAKPFVYALKGIQLDPVSQSEPPPYPGRPSNYFSRYLRKEKHQLAEINTMVFRMCARDILYERTKVV